MHLWPRLQARRGKVKELMKRTALTLFIKAPEGGNLTQVDDCFCTKGLSQVMEIVLQIVIHGPGRN